MRQSETKVRQELQEIHQKLRQFDDEDEQKAGRLADFEVKSALNGCAGCLLTDFQNSNVYNMKKSKGNGFC